jgi:hypothetical protein
MEKIGTDEFEEDWKTVGRETLIQWPEAIRNREYYTGSEGKQWNLAASVV